MSSLLHCFWASGEAETMAEGGRKTELLTLWQLGSREAEGGWRPDLCFKDMHLVAYFPDPGHASYVT